MKYNIIQHTNISLSKLLIFFVLSTQVKAQDEQPGKYGIYAVHSLDHYKETVKEDEAKKMTDLQLNIPQLILDLRYAGTNNFMQRAMYPLTTHHTFMRKPATTALLAVQMDLNAMGYGLKIFDAYRPYSVTVKFWELVHDDRYVADPRKGSGHNRGIAVDLTIIDLQSKQELKMPTGFDNFTDSAHHDFMNLSEEALKNRKLLKDVMEKHGFVAFPTEWWHYSLPQPEKYDVMDLSFEELEKQ
jgi:D-alanyl-D-alanine dipeptidase